MKGNNNKQQKSVDNRDLKKQRWIIELDQANPLKPQINIKHETKKEKIYRIQTKRC